MNDPLELAWAAGFWDGEGSCYLNQGYARMSINQNDVRVLHRFQAAVECGIILPYQQTGKTYWRWRTNRYEEACQVADALWPYLSEVKQDQLIHVFTDAIVVAHEKRSERK